MMKYFPMAKVNVREVTQVGTNQGEDGIPNRNRFYSLQSKVDQE